MELSRPGPLALALASALLSTTAFAEDASRASLSFELSGFRWYRNKSINSFQIPTNESSSRSAFTGDLQDSLVKAQIDAFSVYFYLFQDSNTLLSLSYKLSESWELGIDLGINSTRREKPKNEIDTHVYGAFGRYLQNFGGWQMDHTLLFDVTEFDQTYEDAYQVERSSKGRGTYAQLESRIFVPVAANAWYFAGISYSQTRDKVSGVNGELRSQQLALTLAALRITLD